MKTTEATMTDCVRVMMQAKTLSAEHAGKTVSVYAMRRLASLKVLSYVIRFDRPAYFMADGYAFSPVTAYVDGRERRELLFA